MELHQLSASELAQQIKTKKISSVDVTKHFLKRIEKLDPKLNSFITVSEKAESDAITVDQKIKAGDAIGPLAGVPVGIKDMLCTRGLKTTAGSKILHNFIPPYDSTVVAKLKSAGSIVIGKLNQDEFAMGSSNETSFYGACKNPWNTDCVPGGSSGGSAAAVAAALVPTSIGTDTGGSIRQPASFCGVVGIKPTYGRVSRYGIVAYASSLDQAGPMAANVADAALISEVICGHDPMDSTTSTRKVPAFSSLLKADVKGKKIGLVKEYQLGSLTADTAAIFEQTVEVLKKAGADVIEVSVPYTQVAVAIYYLIATCEASSNLARYDGVKYGYRSEFGSLANLDLDAFYSQTRSEGFGPEIKRRIMLGTYALSSGYYDAYYNKACQVRRLLRDQYGEAFKKCDFILSPVTTTPAFKIGERISDPLAMYLNDIFTTSTNLAGLPGMSVPCGFSKDGLPIGMQLTAPHFEEQRLFDAALVLEKSFDLKGRAPHVV